MNDNLMAAAVMASTIGPPIIAFTIYSVLHERRLQQRRKLQIVRARLHGTPFVADAGMVVTRSVWSYIEGKLFPTKWRTSKSIRSRSKAMRSSSSSSSSSEVATP